MPDATSTDDRWIDVHSVTCAIRGDLADERGTKNLYEEEDTHFEGEAHFDCWDDHDCLEGAWLIHDPDPDVKGDIDPASETVSLPVVCKVCGKSYRICYDFAVLYNPETDMFESPVQFESHTQDLRETVNNLVNNDRIKPGEAQYLRDDITALHDRLEQYFSGKYISHHLLFPVFFQS